MPGWTHKITTELIFSKIATLKSKIDLATVLTDDWSQAYSSWRDIPLDASVAKEALREASKAFQSEVEARTRAHLNLRPTAVWDDAAHRAGQAATATAIVTCEVA